jgi:hypothetical protein
MATFQRLLAGLRRAERELAAQLTGVRAALSALAEGVRNNRSRTGGRRRGRGKAADKAIIIVGGKKRRVSVAARRAMSKAQKARWSKVRAKTRNA